MTPQTFRTLAISLLFSSSVVAGGTSTLFPKAIVTTEDLEAAIKAEWELRRNYDVPPHVYKPKSLAAAIQQQPIPAAEPSFK
jgi:uncharacterized protein (DUF952 family)